MAVSEWEYSAVLATIRHAVATGDLYKAHSFAWGVDIIGEAEADELGLDFGELCAPWESRWGRDAFDGVNPYVSSIDYGRAK